MTREAAIKILKFQAGYFCDLKGCEEQQAFTMAIKALEQEPYADIAQERYKDLCEYFGGAKDILKSREDFKAWLGRVKWHIRKAEELYEKYECKQEACTDAISRQAVLEGLASVAKAKAKSDAQKSLMGRCMFFVEQLPPVNPQEPKTDVLNKIRAEILNFKEKCNASDYLGCGILEIIDKYKAESEE